MNIEHLLTDILERSDKNSAIFNEASAKFEALMLNDTDFKRILQTLIDSHYEIDKKLRDGISASKGKNKKVLKMMLKENQKNICVMAELIRMINNGEVYEYDTGGSN